jgi:CHASE3 domain sensor protein
MDANEKIAAGIMVGVFLLLSIAFIGLFAANKNNHECRIAAIERGISASDIQVMCK